MRNLKLVVVAIFALAFAVACDDDSSNNSNNVNNNNPEICNDGLDNDGDGAIDCNDMDCDTYAGCNTTNNVNNTNNVTTETDCSNGVDDDGDGAIDCADSDCDNDIACATNQCTLATIFYDSADTCDDGFVCTMNDSYQAACVDDAITAGGEFYAACGTNGECPMGSGCFNDGTSNLCMPFCSETHTTCPTPGSCIYGIQGTTEVNLCGIVTACEPFGTDCDTGEACYASSTGWGCAPAGAGAVGSTCAAVNDCAPDLICLGDGTTYACAELCDTANDQCSTGTCQALSGLEPYGACQ
ncbi:hypothetical protein KKF84_06870 [Myxococcota bacterium]|nr:hypothetical protein [Myxococcota bacterium]